MKNSRHFSQKQESLDWISKKEVKKSKFIQMKKEDLKVMH